MIHHVPHPVLFLNEMHRILKKGCKLIIFKIWNIKKSVKTNNDSWDSNQAVAYLLLKNIVLEKVK